MTIRHDSRQVALPVRQLLDDAAQGRLSRRAVLVRGAALGLSVPTIGAILGRIPEVGAQDSTVRIGYELDIAFLDPQKVQSDQDLAPSNFIFGRLTAWDATMLDPQPDIAESWTQPDDVTYVFKLRQGVKFHSGREVTADDVVFSFQRAIDIGPEGRGAGELREVDTFTATGPLEFTVKLKQPSAVFLAATGHWALAVLDKDTIDQIDTKPNGTGPFKFGEWVPEQSVTYQKNADYWNQQALAGWPNEIVTQPIAESLTRIANLQQGQIEIAANIPAQYVSQIEGDSNLQLIRQPYTASYWTIAFNVTKPPFDNLTLRQAIARAIDKDTIHQNAFFGLGEVGCSLIPQGHWAYDETIECPPRDVEAAKALMAQAGYTDGLKVTFKYGGNSPDIEPPMAEILKSNLAEIGIDLDLQLMEANLWLQEVWLDKNFEMTNAWYTREPDPDALMQSVLREGGGNNVMGYVNPKIEELFDEGKRTLDQAARKPIYSEITKIMLEDTPLVKLQTVDIFWAASTAIHGMQLQPKGCPTFLNWSYSPAQ